MAAFRKVSNQATGRPPEYEADYSPLSDAGSEF